MVKIYDFLQGIVLALGIKFVMTPPAVSIPKLNGVASSTNTSYNYSPPVFVKMAA